MATVRQALSDLISVKTALRGIGLLVFGAILWNLDLGKTWSYLRNVDVPTLIYGYLLSIPILVIRAFRWNRIKQSLSIDVSVGRSCLYQLIATMSFLTPGRVGEIIKAVYLKGNNFPFTTSVISIVIDRITDLILIVGTAYVALFFLSPLSPSTAWSLVLVGVAVCLFTLLVFRGSLRTLLMAVVRAIVPERVSVKIEEVIDRVVRYFSSRSVRWYTFIVGLTVSVYVLQVYRFRVFARSLGFTVPFLPLAGIIAIMVTSNLLPISISGLGTREAVLVFYLTQYGIDAERVLGISAILLLNVVLHALAGSITFTMVPPSISLEQIMSSSNNSSE